jgi:hypothetical protein
MSSERDTQLVRLEAELERQQALIDLLLAERAERQAPRAATKRSKPTQAAGEAPHPEGQPTSRRGLLKRLGTSAAGAAAATTLGLAQARSAQADFDGTKAGESTAQFGIYASPNGVGRPAVGASGLFGVLGTNIAGVVTPVEVGNAGVAGFSHIYPGVAGRSFENVGVVGSSGSLNGVSGTTDAVGSDWAGVMGTAANSHGVIGISFSGAENAGVRGQGFGNARGVLGLSTAATGVLGSSTAAEGVRGVSTNSHGVFGQTSAAAGTVTNGMLAAGVAGRTGGTIALYGFSDGPPNPNYAPVGAVGQCNNGFGVWGLSSAGPGAASKPGGGSPTAISGVLGTSTSGIGVYAISSGSYGLAADGNGPTTVAVLGRGLGGGKAGVFVGNVEIQGHLSVTGGINGPAAAGRADGASAVGAPENPEPLVALGDGQLVAGQATVRFEPAFATTLADGTYRVFLTEYDDHHGLYVTDRTRQGFTVRAKDSPTASGSFSYRVVASSRTTRAVADAAPLHVPTIPVPQGVPTLPTGPTDPQPAPPPSRPPSGPRAR